MTCPYGRPKEGDVPPGGTARSARSAPKVERGQGRAYDNGVAVVEGSMSWARACPRLMDTGSSSAVERGQGRAYDNGVAVVGRTTRSARGAH